MRFFAVILLYLLANKSSEANQLFDIIETVVNEAFGIVGAGINAIPDIPEVVDLGIQAILGLPFSALLNGANILCSLAASQDRIESHLMPDLRNIQFQFRTACNSYSYPVAEGDQIVSNPEFDVNKKTVIVVTGWTTTVNDTLTNTMRILTKAYNCRGDYNFLAFDDLNYLQTWYTWAAVNTQTLGRYLAVGVQHLAEVMPYENIHLVGHSLGAHLVGVAGRHFTELTGKKLKRITGLDPANPCFNEGEELQGIFRGDAEFVDIIHTTPGALGHLGPMGDVDFYAGGLRPLKPGCLDVTCSHIIAGDYYAESVYPNNANNFMARRCTSLAALRNEHCRGEEIPMGFAVPHDAVGFYFLEVNAEEPYGANATQYFQSSTSQCGTC